MMTDQLDLIYENVKNSSPKLSVIIPSYNHEIYIEECLSSISLSELKDIIEIIVIDDGSTDKTLFKAESFLKINGIPARIYKKSNRGLTDSLNFGLSIARGDYIAFMASDDMYISDNIIKIVSDLKFINYNMMIYQAQFFGDAIGNVYNDDISSLLEKNVSYIREYISVEVPKPMLLQSTIFNTNFLRFVDPWRDKLISDDWPTFIRSFYLLNDKEFHYEKDISICKYRIHNVGLHNNIDRQLNSCIQVANIVVKQHYRKVCLSNIYIDRSFNFLKRKEFLKFLKYFFRGLLKDPSFRTISRIKSKIFEKIMI